MRKVFDLSAAIAAVEVTEVEELTFGELARGWIAHCQSGRDELRLGKWIATFGDRSAWSITTADIAMGFLAMQQSGVYKNSTVNRDVGSIGSMYKWAIGRRICPVGFVSPTVGVKRLSEADSIRRIFISPEQLQQLRDMALLYRDRRFGVFVNLLIDTGARKGELYERRWKDVDLFKREIILHDSKTGVPRILHFSAQTAKLIARVCPVRNEEGLMFPGADPSLPKSYRASWTKLTKEVGLPDLHMHDVRHDRARRLLAGGTSLAVAAAIMGHSPQMLTRRYGHLDVTDAKLAVEKSWQIAA